MRRLTPIAILLALAAGCGEDRTDPPDVTTPVTPAGTAAASYPDQGVTFAAPGGWRVRPGQPPLVATVQSGTATIAIWRYPRSERLPRTGPTSMPRSRRSPARRRRATRRSRR
jgi:hypothetical protein